MVVATLEVLEEGELIFGCRTNGGYLVRECEKNEEMGGSFFKTEEEAKAHIKTLTRDNMKMWLEEITTAILLGGLLYLTIIVMFTLI
jgi:hypothetical protein